MQNVNRNKLSQERHALEDEDGPTLQRTSITLHSDNATLTLEHVAAAGVAEEDTRSSALT